MQWTNFACSSPPQSKILLKQHTNSRKSKSKSKSKNQHTFSSQKFKPYKDASPRHNQLDNTISALFVKEMKEEEAKSKTLKDICDAILEIRDIQKQQLESNKRTLKLLEQSTMMRRDKSTIKKKKNYNNPYMEKQVQEKIKQFDKMKNDLTHMLRKSRSSQKTHKKSISIIKVLR